MTYEATYSRINGVDALEIDGVVVMFTRHDEDGVLQVTITADEASDEDYENFAIVFCDEVLR